ncbi:short chain dehydrogenase family protein [Mycobacterium xenopi 4042]|uniref:Short chain dehydrogenase family protein n=1 Tax=Mycobacterium xenopi 4042 TaxID=1299334 RepID=X8AHU6_MYCXE|nr:short chain dehydrogenase family protein [Mycobacterium xenopi 4042]
MAGRVQDKVVLVTGGARGQGRSHAVKLAEEGADVILFDICQDIETNRYPLATPRDLEEAGLEVEKAAGGRSPRRWMSVTEPR